MFNLLDSLIERLLDTGWNAPPAKPGFYFSVPDEAWRPRVKAGGDPRLDVYLYEARENRNFRRPGWDLQELPDRTYGMTRPPAYFDCSYLISAWSPVDDTDGVSPVPDEHGLLAEAARVLLCSPEVIPGDLGVGSPGSLFRQAPVYFSLTPPEAPRAFNDFWSTMKIPWRPALQLVATAPLDLRLQTGPFPPVTTLATRYVLVGTAGIEERIDMGGWVVRDTDNSPIEGALVRLAETGEQTTTDAQGRFRFVGLRSGIHHLHVEAAGLTAVDRALDLPAAPADDHLFKLS